MCLPNRRLVVAPIIMIALSLPLVAGAASREPGGRLSWVACGGSPDGCIWQTVRGDGSELRTLREFIDRDAPLSVELAPNGAAVAMAEAGQIVVRSASSGRRLRLLARLGQTDNDVPLAWSADGKQLAYATSRAVWTVGLDNAAPRLYLRRKNVTALAWSPMGGKLAFLQRREGGRTELWVARRARDRGRRLAVGFIFGKPSWSADGTRVAFALSQSAAALNGDVYSASVDSGGRRRLGGGITATYSPASNAVAHILLSRSSPNVTLVVSTLDGGRRRIPVEWDGAAAPVWSPDGREVVGVKTFALETVRVDGHERREIADTLVYVTDLSWNGRK